MKPRILGFRLLAVLLLVGVCLFDCRRGPIFPPDGFHFEMLRIYGRESGWVSSSSPALTCVRATEPLCPCGPDDIGEAVAGLPIELRLDLNRATREELENLPRIGPTIAERIISHRQTEPFESIHELLEIDGIGVATLRRIHPLVRLSESD